jgi:hypothetical protein
MWTNTLKPLYIFFLSFLLLSLVFSGPLTSSNNTIYDNILSLPQLNKSAALLSNTSLFAPIRDLLNSTNGSLWTVYIPNNEAIIEDNKKIDEILTRSGYPTIEEQFGNKSLYNDIDYSSTTASRLSKIKSSSLSERSRLRSEDSGSASFLQ